MNLRILRPRDIEALAWLPEVGRTAGSARWADPASISEGVGERSVLTNNARTALVAFKLDHPTRRTATVDFLAVTPAERRLGTGARTAVALERRLEKTVDALFVQVPASIGLALYFWIRLGYRPLPKNEWPIDPSDPHSCAWMKRLLV